MADQSGKEIEVKYLIYEDGIDYSTPALKALSPSINELEKSIFEHGYIINQGYLSINQGLEIARMINLDVKFNPTVARLRSKSFFSQKPKEYYFALKGSGMISRDELELSIDSLLFTRYWRETEGKRIKKVRYEKPHDFYNIEFDTYIDDRPDLIVAEIEVKKLEDIAKIIPLGLDVSNHSKYKNNNLAK